MVEREVPSLPHGVLEGGGQGRVGLWRAVERAHDALGEEEVPEERCDEEVLSEQLLEEVCMRE